MTTTTAAPPSLSPTDPSDPARADLPVLDHVPVLGTAMELVRRIDRDVASLIDALLELQDHDIAETATGVALDQWLAIVGRRTSSDRRMLLTACDALRRLPALRSAFLLDAQVSWSQVRAVALAVERVPRRLDDLIDQELARTISACRGDDPDHLVSAITRAVRSLDATVTTAPQEAAERERFVSLQPRLDGTGGRLFGEFGPLGFATIDAALSGPAQRPETADADGHTDADAHTSAGCAAPRPYGRVGRVRADRLIALCDRELAGATGGADPDARGAASGKAGDGPGTAPRGSRPQLLVRMDLATLLDHHQMPAELLTDVTGGRLWIDSATARRLVDARGADLRAVVLDDTGKVVGVGRRARFAPAWLRDATLALHDTCTAPGCPVAARRCDTDHATPWQAVSPDQPTGRTDIDQLAPLCAFHNHRKEASGWQVSQSGDGSRRWHHARSGLTTTTRPATWRAPPPADEDSTHLGVRPIARTRDGPPP